MRPNILLIVLILILTLQLYLLTLSVRGSADPPITEGNATWLLLYEFEGYALLAYDNFTPITLMYKNTYKSLGKSYDIDVKDILEYVKGTNVYDIVIQMLNNTDRVVVEVSCKYDIDENVNVTREADVLRIEVPGGPCITDPLPVLLRIKGKVYINANDDRTIFVKVAINATLPLSEGWIPVASNWKLISLICGPLVESNCSGQVIQLVSPLYVIRDGEVYEESRKIGNFFPFYVMFPRNATEVKQVVEGGIELKYYDFDVEISMVKYIKMIAKYGSMPEAREVSEIQAYIINPLHTSELKTAVESLGEAVFVKVKYFVPRQLEVAGYPTQVLGLIISALTNETLRLDYVEAYARTLGPYTLVSFIKPPSQVNYIYNYPVFLKLVPLKVIAKEPDGDTVRLALYIVAKDINYYGVDPYSIDIGYYAGPARGGQGIGWWGLLVVLGLAALAVFALVWVRRR